MTERVKREIDLVQVLRLVVVMVYLVIRENGDDQNAEVFVEKEESQTFRQERRGIGLVPINEHDVSVDRLIDILRRRED